MLITPSFTFSKSSVRLARFFLSVLKIHVRNAPSCAAVVAVVGVVVVVLVVVVVVESTSLSLEDDICKYCRRHKHNRRQRHHC